MNEISIKIGILALHGAFYEHQAVLQKLDPTLEFIFVKKPEDLGLIDALLIPGGESTTMGILAEKFGLIPPLKEFIRKGFPVMGTCAGLILLSNEFVEESLMEGQKQRCIGGLNVKIWRNYFGSQVESFVDKIKLSILAKPIDAIFIRAPAIIEAGEGVEILGKIKHKNHEGVEKEVIVAVKQGNLLCASFHPELCDENLWHQYFLGIVKRFKGVNSN